MKKKLIILFIIFVAVSVPIAYFAIIHNPSVPAEAFEKKGIVTRISPDCGEETILVDGEAQISKEPILCDGGGYISIDDKSIQYQTGNVLSDSFFYDIGDIKVGDNVTVIYIFNNNTAQINCDGCGIFK